MGSPHLPIRSNRNPFAVKYEIHQPTTTDPERISFSGSSAILDRLQATAEININNSASSGNNGIENGSNNINVSGNGTNYLQPNITVNPAGIGTIRSSRSKNGRLNRISGMTSSSSATSSNSNPTNRSERERQKLREQHLQQQQQQHQLKIELKDSQNDDNLSDMDKNIFEPPPEPAPPEIPPRTQSLLISLKKRSDYQLKFDDSAGQKHEEFIPQSQQKGKFLLLQSFISVVIRTKKNDFRN